MGYGVIFRKKNTAQLKLDLSQKIRDKTKRVTCASCKNGTSNGRKACMEGLVFSKGNLV